MAGLAHDPAHYFKFLFILVLYTLCMTLFVSLNFPIRPASADPSAELPPRDTLPKRRYRHPHFGAFGALPDDLRGLLRPPELDPACAAVAAVALPAQVHARGTVRERGWLGAHDPGCATRCAGECVGKLDYEFGRSSLCAREVIFLELIQTYTVIRVRREQLLSRCIGAIWLYRSVWAGSHWNCLVTGTRTAVDWTAFLHYAYPSWHFPILYK